MELNRHDCAVFGIGAAVGGLLAWAGSYIFFRKKVKALTNEIIDDEACIKDLRIENQCLMETRDALIEADQKKYRIPESASDTGRDKGVLSRQQRDDIRKKLEKNYEGTTNYAGLHFEEGFDDKEKQKAKAIEQVQKFANSVEQKAKNALGIESPSIVHFQNDLENDIFIEGKDVPDIYADIEGKLAEQEHPEDDEPEIDESYADPREQEHEGDISATLPESSKEADVDEFFKEHQKKKGRKPRIISVEEAANLPEYIETMTLFYYATNEVMVDEDEEIIEDPERIIGDALTKYDFANNDEQRIFVMNYELDTCFEVCKILGSYEVD